MRQVAQQLIWLLGLRLEVIHRVVSGTLVLQRVGHVAISNSKGLVRQVEEPNTSTVGDLAVVLQFVKLVERVVKAVYVLPIVEGHDFCHCLLGVGDSRACKGLVFKGEGLELRLKLSRSIDLVVRLQLVLGHSIRGGLLATEVLVAELPWCLWWSSLLVFEGLQHVFLF